MELNLLNDAETELQRQQTSLSVDTGRLTVMQ